MRFILTMVLVLVAACSSVEEESNRPLLANSPSAGGASGSAGGAPGAVSGAGSAGVGACCPESSSPGCQGHTAVEQCVCASDNYCCVTRWDRGCANEVVALGCADRCDAVAGAGGSAGAPACCPAKDTPGCSDAAVQACVCTTYGNGFCCSTRWDIGCQNDANILCHCEGPPPPPPTKTCCEENPEVKGCSDSTVQTCVCTHDPDCCNVGWDDLCVSEVGQYGCGPACPTP